MFVRINTDRTARPHTLDDFGMASGSNATISLNEFTYKQGAEIYGESEPAEYVYQVKEGAIRSYKLLSDGRRQIAAFHLVGDIFGLANGGGHRFTAEAVVETTLRLVKRQSIELMAESDAIVARTLLALTSNDLQHAENHVLLLGRKTSVERVAAFLAEMDPRLPAASAMTLPMNRLDIADYLGLTIETVSRALSQMRRAGVLDFISKTQREIVILDRQRLATFDSSRLANANSAECLSGCRSPLPARRRRTHLSSSWASPMSPPIGRVCKSSTACGVVGQKPTAVKSIELPDFSHRWIKELRSMKGPLVSIECQNPDCRAKYSAVLRDKPPDWQPQCVECDSALTAMERGRYVGFVCARCD